MEFITLTLVVSVMTGFFTVWGVSMGYKMGLGRMPVEPRFPFYKSKNDTVEEKDEEENEELRSVWAKGLKP